MGPFMLQFICVRYIWYIRFIFLIHVGINSLETQLYSQLPVGKKLPPFFRGEILCVYRHFSGGKDC